MPDRIAPDVVRIRVPLPFRPREVHAYLLRGDEGWVLVDGGINTEACWSVVDAAVREAAGGWAAVRLNLITHMHLDHLGLVERVRTASGCAVGMGRLDAERAAHAREQPQEEADYRERLLRENGAPDGFVAAVQAGREQAAPLASWASVDHALEGGGEALPGAAAWRVVWTPGHTAGHIGLFRGADRLLLAGDAVLPGISPTVGVNRQRSDPVGDYLDALRRLAALAPSRILPGHGEPIEQPAARLAELEEETRSEQQRVLALLGAEPAAAWTLAERRYAGRALPDSMRMQALRETRAHLDHLEAAGRARRVELGSGVQGFQAR